VVKKFLNLVGRLVFLASFYIVFLLFAVPIIHIEVQKNLSKRLPQSDFEMTMPYAKCFRQPSPEGIVESLQHSYDRSLNVGQCIRREAEGYMKIFKTG